MFSHDLGHGVSLGALEPWQADKFLAAVEADRNHLLDAIPFSHSVHSLDDARAFLQRFADGHAADTMHLAGMWSHDDLIGLVMLHVFVVQQGYCELGVWINREYEGRGLVAAAARYVIGWAIETRGMARVEWITQVGNERSRATAERLGFKFEGIKRASYVVYPGGPRHDCELWSLVATDWVGPGSLI